MRCPEKMYNVNMRGGEKVWNSGKPIVKRQTEEKGLGKGN